MKNRDLTGTKALRTILGALLATASFAAAASTNLTDMTELSLAAATRIARDANPSLAAAAARVTQARARLHQARSQYYPSITGSASALHVDAADATYRPELGLDDPARYYRTEVSAMWVLFDGFARRFTVALARLGAAESEAARREADRQLVLALTQTYLSAQLARENMTIGRADAAFNSRLLEETRARRVLGGAALSDELNFEIRANAADSQWIEAQREHAMARIGLAALMGLAAGTLPEDLRLSQLEPERPEELVRPNTTDLLETAVLNRPDLTGARAALFRAETARKVARAAYAPTVALSAGLNGERAENPSFSSEDFGLTAGLTLSYMFFNGGRRRAELLESGAAVQEAQHRLLETELAVRRDTRNAAVALVAAQAQLQLQMRNTALVKQNRDLVEKEYAAGQNSLTRLNEAQRDLVAAQVALARARVALRRAQAELDAAVGQGNAAE